MTKRVCQLTHPLLCFYLSGFVWTGVQSRLDWSSEPSGLEFDIRKCCAIVGVLTVSCHSEQREESRKVPWKVPARDPSAATLCQDDIIAGISVLLLYLCSYVELTLNRSPASSGLKDL